MLPVFVIGQPLRSALLGFFNVTETVAFYVCLGNYIESKLVGDVEEIGVGRLVRGADGVDVTLPHPYQIRAHGLVGNGASREVVVFMPIYSIYYNWFTVDMPVGTDDFDAAEADLLADSAIIESDEQCVQDRCFSGP